uniref:Uncharacterized protein n=1 Tax=Catharus ustulatus TaxID=91951 RepID=A0A8C3U7Y4_CATUS
FFCRVADGSSWHERCLRCCACGCALQGSCFCRGSKIYCRPDYERLFLQRCSRCQVPVGRSEPILRVLQGIFHQQCMSCNRCSRRLRRGDRFVLRRGRLLCHIFSRIYPDGNDPDRNFSGDFPDGNNPNGNFSGDFSGNFSMDFPGNLGKDPKRSKRPRTILSSQQRRTFRDSFELSPKPCRKVRETLAAQTGLTVRVVQVWFQNQRAKMKKMARRQQEQLGNSRGEIPAGRGNFGNLGINSQSSILEGIPGNFGNGKLGIHSQSSILGGISGNFGNLGNGKLRINSQSSILGEIPGNFGNGKLRINSQSSILVGIPGNFGNWELIPRAPSLGDFREFWEWEIGN